MKRIFIALALFYSLHLTGINVGDVCVASFQEDYEPIKKYIAGTDDVNKPLEKRGNVTLLYALVNGAMINDGFKIDLETLDLLLAKKNLNVNAQTIEGRTALHSLVTLCTPCCSYDYNHLAIVMQKLLKRGANPNILDIHGELPFDITTNPTLRKLLLDAGTDVTKTNPLPKRLYKTACTGDIPSMLHILNLPQANHTTARSCALKLFEKCRISENAACLSIFNDKGKEQPAQKILVYKKSIKLTTYYDHLFLLLIKAKPALLRDVVETIVKMTVTNEFGQHATPEKKN